LKFKKNLYSAKSLPHRTIMYKRKKIEKKDLFFV